MTLSVSIFHFGNEYGKQAFLLVKTTKRILQRFSLGARKTGVNSFNLVWLLSLTSETAGAGLEPLGMGPVGLATIESC